MTTFVDRVVLHLQAGDGGHGGSIKLVVDPQQHTLLDFHFHPHVKGPNGGGGAGANRDGANGKDLVTDAAVLAHVAVTGEVVAHTKGPKIRIHKFKSKTGYHKRQGHRQPLTLVKVTGISSGK